jgi:hypothetical protein
MTTPRHKTTSAEPRPRSRDACSPRPRVSVTLRRTSSDSTLSFLLGASQHLVGAKSQEAPGVGVIQMPRDMLFHGVIAGFSRHRLAEPGPLEARVYVRFAEADWIQAGHVQAGARSRRPSDLLEAGWSGTMAPGSTPEDPHPAYIPPAGVQHATAEAADLLQVPWPVTAQCSNDGHLNR